ncbi:MAG: hypothetical protein GY854_34815, partial [Deltaproteobacteria bacterium]|nr:hypothetical protein [Deltaproteobacteria bacterium]
KVKEKLDFDDIYLRGRYQEVPVMVELDGTAGWVSIDTKCNVPFEDMSLDWDLEKIPVEADDDDDDDDWGDEEEIRVFLAKGVFAEGGKSEVYQVMDAFASLPKDLGDEILTTMQTRRLTRFGIYGDGVHLGFDEDFYEMSDPIAEIKEVLVFTTKIAKILGAAKPVEGSPTKFVIAGAAPAAALQLVTCSYCHTKFNMGANSRCPNCGAPYTE